MKQDYVWVIDRIIHKYEGGYGNDPHDPGGPTKYGITYIDLAEHLGIARSQAYNLVRTMSLGTAEQIYASKYAVKCKFDALNPGVDMLILDYDINSGIARGPRVLQALFGTKQTGIMDDNTIKTANLWDPIKLIDQVCDERLHFMHQIKGGASWQAFGHGWQSRIDDLRTTCKQLNKTPRPSDDMGAAIAFDDEALSKHGKATHIDPAPKKTVAKSMAVAAPASATSHMAHHNLLITGLTVGGVLTAGGLLYWQIHKQQLRNQNTVVFPPTTV